MGDGLLGADVEAPEGYGDVANEIVADSSTLFHGKV